MKRQKFRENQVKKRTFVFSPFFEEQLLSFAYRIAMIQCVLESPSVGKHIKVLTHVITSSIQNFLEPHEIQKFVKKSS